MCSLSGRSMPLLTSCPMPLLRIRKNSQTSFLNWVSGELLCCLSSFIPYDAISEKEAEDTCQNINYSQGGLTTTGSYGCCGLDFDPAVTLLNVSLYVQQYKGTAQPALSRQLSHVTYAHLSQNIQNLIWQLLHGLKTSHLRKEPQMS